MDLSIVIVNYNVRHFLAQCLRSVEVACQGLAVEVFVVDNNSVDGSVAMVRQDFPWVTLMANQDNVGFSRANNQAMRVAQGRHILLLNPDTVVEEDTFRQVVAFMDHTPDAGALGVYMVNGDGEFLPESKRALPTPWVAFYKIFGLAKLFPHSQRFGRYHLTYLDPQQTHVVEVLSGAFMLLRRETLDKIGLLDEDYFMYGEDIDLSYRVTLGGWKNYYYPHTRIIHYKGESTKKGSLNYVLVFYNAMLIFARKHFSQQRQTIFMALIKAAIYFRAGLSIIRRTVGRIVFPVAEFALLWVLMFGIKEFWQDFAGYPDDYYPERFDYWVTPAYALIYVLALGLTGSYRRPYRVRQVGGAVVYAFITIATSSYLIKSINFSRAIVSLGALGALLSTLLVRGLLNWRNSGSFFLDEQATRRTLLVGCPDETARVRRLLDQDIGYNYQLVGILTETGDDKPGQHVLGRWDQMDEVIRFYQVEEIVFCNASISTRTIIAAIHRLQGKRLHFKIAPKDADYLVGPNQIITTEDAANPLRLHGWEARMKKQLFDVAVSGVLLAAFPLTFWVYHRPRGAIRNLWQVFTGQRHLVGYTGVRPAELPPLKNCLLSLEELNAPLKSQAAQPLSAEQASRLNWHYARHYSPALDWTILTKGLRKLGTVR
jgi:GT2 family glycosyltransferase